MVRWILGIPSKNTGASLPVLDPPFDDKRAVWFDLGEDCDSADSEGEGLL